MSKAAHTMGEWLPNINEAHDHRSMVAYIEVNEGPYRGDVARLQSCEHIDGIGAAEMIANARLISAAPDLLEALGKTAVALDEMTSDDWDGDIDHKAVRQALHEARAAIAKAEGGDA